MPQHRIRVIVNKAARRVILEPEGIELSCIKSADVHLDADRLKLTLTIPDWLFDVDITGKEETHDRA